jgi:hypothetical protein
MALDAHAREHVNPKQPVPANLRHRPSKPSYRNGPVQKIVLRAIEALRLANTAQIAQWAYVERFHRGEGFERWHYGHIRKALEQIGAIRVGRASGRGRAIEWRLSKE